MRKVVKVLVIAGIALFALWVVLGLFAGDSGSAAPPDIDDAAYSLKADTRLYYMQDYEQTDSQVIIRRYWAYEAGEYEYYDGSMTFNRKAYLKLEIAKR